MKVIERTAEAAEVVPAEGTKPEEGVMLSTQPGKAPSPWLALALFALSMPLNRHIGGWAQDKNLVWGLILTEWGLILLPVLGLIWCARANLRETLRLKKFSGTQGAGAAVMAVSIFVLVIGFSTLQNLFLSLSDSPEKKETLVKLFQVGATWPGLVALLFVMALSPAICEEALFRGVLLSSLGQRTRPVFAILAVAVLFGVYHGSFCAFAPTALMGLGITYAAWRTNSLWIGAMMHFIVNATSALWHTGTLPNVFAWFLLSATLTNGLWAGILVLTIALAGLLVGIALIEAGSRRPKTIESF